MISDDVNNIFLTGSGCRPLTVSIESNLHHVCACFFPSSTCFLCFRYLYPFFFHFSSVNIHDLQTEQTIRTLIRPTIIKRNTGVPGGTVISSNCEEWMVQYRSSILTSVEPPPQKRKPMNVPRIPVQNSHSGEPKLEEACEKCGNLAFQMSKVTQPSFDVMVSFILLYVEYGKFTLVRKATLCY